MLALGLAAKLLAGDSVSRETIDMLLWGVPLVFSFGLHLVGLRKGWKFSYYLHFVFASLICLGVIINSVDLISGNPAFVHLNFEWDDGPWSLVKIFTSVSYIIIYLLLPMLFLNWFKPEVKAWFGIAKKRKNSPVSEPSILS